MANTITFTAKLKVNSTDGTYQNSEPIAKTVNTQTCLGAGHHTTQSVGTSFEEVSVGDVAKTTEYAFLLINRHATAVITVRLNDGTNQIEGGKIRPGEPFMCRAKLQTANYPAWEIKSDTAATPVEVIVGEAGTPAT